MFSRFYAIPGISVRRCASHELASRSDELRLTRTAIRCASIDPRGDSMIILHIVTPSSRPGNPRTILCNFGKFRRIHAHPIWLGVFLMNDQRSAARWGRPVPTCIIPSTTCSTIDADHDPPTYRQNHEKSFFTCARGPIPAD